MKSNKTQLIKVLLLLCAFLFLLTSCQNDPPPPEDNLPGNNDAPEQPPDTQVTPEPRKDHMQLIPDLTFQNGIQILSQADHNNGNVSSVLGTRDLYNGGDAPQATWKLAQWDSGPCLFDSMVESSPNIITDGQGRSFSYNPKNGYMTFELDTALYYQGKPAVSGDYWPHLLIEQPDFGYFQADKETQAFYRCDSDKLIVSFDIRLTDYEKTYNAKDWVEAAQFLMYFYVRGVDTDDFCWFGLQLFDNRWERNDHYIGYDNGNAATSGAMIYSIGSKYIFPEPDMTFYENGEPNPYMEVIHVEIDIKPYLEDMLAHGLADHYFTVTDLSELCINGMNVGWETIGTFDHTMEIRNLELISYRSE